MTAPYPEPRGAFAAMGFVKCNPLNNDYYVELWKDNPWYYIIKWAHDTLTERYPGYNISQIKEKFGGLRFYIDPPSDWDDEACQYGWQKWERSADIIRYAEAWVDGFNYARRTNE